MMSKILQLPNVDLIKRRTTRNFAECKWLCNWDFYATFLWFTLPILLINTVIMSVRGQSHSSILRELPRLTVTAVVARIRPLLGTELDKDTIVRAECSQEGKPMNIVRIPNPKNEAEEFSFTFNGVYDMETTQEELFTSEGTTIDMI